jgi:hypothetical protein
MKNRTWFTLRVWVLLVGIAGAWASARADVPLPATAEEIQAMIAETGDADDYGGADFVYVLDEADVYVQDSGLASTESCQVIKVLTDAGVRSRSVLRLEFDPQSYRYAIRAIRIHRQHGGIENVPVDSTVVQPAPQFMIYWGNRQQVLDLPRLEVGDCIEIRIGKIGFNIAYLTDSGSGAAAGSGADALSGEGLIPPMEGHWYEVQLFQGRQPILNKRYSVHMPGDKPVQFEEYNGSLRTSIWFNNDEHVYTFSEKDIPAVKSEPRMVALDDCVPKVVLATVPDWETKSRWFYDVNETQFEANEAIKKKVAEITKGLDEEEAIQACLHWVADNIRYYGTSRGPCEGYTLHTGIETFRDRGGVCKDIAGMLVTMLRVLGHESYAAMTMAGSRVERIPADQFNHTVTLMRNKDGSFRILDPTWSPLSKELWSSREAEQHLVYGTPEGQDLTTSPYFSPEYNLAAMTAKSEINADGTLWTRIDADLKGYACTYLRRSVGRYANPEQRAALEAVLNIAPQASLEEYEHNDPYDYSTDSWLKMKVTAPGFAAVGEGTQMFKLPLMTHVLQDWLIPDFFYPTSLKERKYGMRMRATRLVKYEDRIKLPRGWEVTHMPEAKSIESPIADMSFEIEQEGRELVYRFEFCLKKSQVSPEDYPKFKEAIDAMKEISADWIVCTTKG